MIAMTHEMAKWLLERKIHITGKLNIGHLRILLSWFSRQKWLAEFTTCQVNEEKIILLYNIGYRAPLFRLQTSFAKKISGVQLDITVFAYVVILNQI